MITIEELQNGKVRLEFGNKEQINIVKKEEEKLVKMEKAGEGEDVIYEEVTCYTAVCPHCKTAGEPADSINEAFYFIMEEVSFGFAICNNCEKRIFPK